MPVFHDQFATMPTSTERVLREIGEGHLQAGMCSLHENVIVPGAAVPLHRHGVQEVIVCLAGQAECSFNGGTPERYRAGSVVVIPANMPHTITNSGAEMLRQLAFFSSPDPQTVWLEPPGSIAFDSES